MRTLIVASLVALTGCSFTGGIRFDLMQELRDSVRVQTNLPVGRNSVVVACPRTSFVSHCVIRKFDQWTPAGGEIVANLEPGAATMVPFSGLFSDQHMTLQVLGLNAQGVTTGESRRMFYASNAGNSGTQEVWEPPRYEFEQRR